MSAVLALKNICTQFGAQILHEHLNLTINKGEIIAIVGGSGSGKTTLMREMLSLERPRSGEIFLFGEDICRPINPDKLKDLQRRCGVMFQGGALFSGLTVLENVMFPLREFTTLSPEQIEAIGRLKIAFALLPPQSANRYPAELSGGMIKRAAVARALAMDPELLFLDEPTAGLDPISASEFDDLLLTLRKNLGLTIVIITHDVDTLARVPDKIAFLGRRQVLAVDTYANLSQATDPLIQAYFNNPRARAAIPDFQHRG